MNQERETNAGSARGTTRPRAGLPLGVGLLVLLVGAGLAVVFLSRRPPSSGTQTRTTSAPQPRPTPAVRTPPVAGRPGTSPAVAPPAVRPSVVKKAPTPPPAPPTPKASAPALTGAKAVEEFKTGFQKMQAEFARLDELDAAPEEKSAQTLELAAKIFGGLAEGFQDLLRVVPRLPLTAGERDLLGLRLSAAGDLTRSRCLALGVVARSDGGPEEAEALLEKEGMPEAYEQTMEKLDEHPAAETLNESLEKIGIQAEPLFEMIKMLG